MNMETEQFFLKPRGDRLLTNQNQLGGSNEQERLPKEIITIEVEQPSLPHDYQTVEFFVTGTYLVIAILTIFLLKKLPPFLAIQS